MFTRELHQDAQKLGYSKDKDLFILSMELVL